jgi:hypothetical protein
MRKLFLPSYKTSNMAPRNFVWLTKQGLSGAGHRQRRLCSAPRPVAHMGRAVASSWKPTVAAEQSKAQPGHFLWGLAVWASPRAIWVYWGSAGSRAHPTCPRFGMPRRLCPLPSVPVVPGASRASLTFVLGHVSSASWCFLARNRIPFFSPAAMSHRWAGDLRDCDHIGKGGNGSSREYTMLCVPTCIPHALAYASFRDYYGLALAVLHENNGYVHPIRINNRKKSIL